MNTGQIIAVYKMLPGDSLRRPLMVKAVLSECSFKHLSLKSVFKIVLKEVHRPSVPAVNLVNLCRSAISLVHGTRDGMQ